MAVSTLGGEVRAAELEMAEQVRREHQNGAGCAQCPPGDAGQCERLGTWMPLIVQLPGSR